MGISSSAPKGSGSRCWANAKTTAWSKLNLPEATDDQTSRIRSSDRAKNTSRRARLADMPQRCIRNAAVEV